MGEQNGRVSDLSEAQIDARRKEPAPEFGFEPDDCQMRKIE